MRIGAIQFPVFNPYHVSAIEIYVAGCTRKCDKCFNPELQNFSEGKELVWSELKQKLKDRSQLFDVISVVGGDLLCQNEAEARLFSKSLSEAFTGKETWLFTGEKEENLPKWVFDYFDKIKVGCYDDKLKQDGFPASSNQKLIVSNKRKANREKH